MNRWQWFQLTGFNLYWLICVIGQNDWLILQAIVLLIFCYWAPNEKCELTRFMIFLPGVFIDLMLMKMGLFSFSDFPYWLIFLWIGFSLSINHGFSWLINMKLYVIAMIGAIAGPASYFAGYQLNAVEFNEGIILTMFVLAIIWAMLLPVMVILNNYKSFRKI